MIKASKGVVLERRFAKSPVFDSFQRMNQWLSLENKLPFDFFLSFLQFIGALRPILLKNAEPSEVQCGDLEAEEHFTSEPSANRHPVHPVLPSKQRRYRFHTVPNVRQLTEPFSGSFFQPLRTQLAFPRNGFPVSGLRFDRMTH